MAALTPARPASRLAIWIQAARPRTLPAALAPIAVGTAAAASEGRVHGLVAAAALATGVLLQVGANLANDVFDFERGADTKTRQGPARATQSGWVSPHRMRRATFVTLGLAACMGLVLVLRGGLPLAVAGILALAAAYAYTGGPWPLGYRGLGDAMVFVFFGPVAVVGSAYLQTLALSARALVLAVPVGLLATAILVVNNLRDMETDAVAGKRTLAVRMGVRTTRRYYAALLGTAYAWIGVGVGAGGLPPACLLALAVGPWSAALVRGIARREGAALNPLLGATALHEAAFAALLVVGLLA